MNSQSDRIEKTILLRAPLARVWSAISDARQFGAWFGIEFDGQFVAGKSIAGKIVPTKADPEVAKMQEQYSGFAFEVWIAEIEPMHLFSFRWHPYAVDPDTDYSQEPTTLVSFALAEVANGTRLTVTESGFDRIPVARRAEAFKANEQGWTLQTTLIEKYLARHP